MTTLQVLAVITSIASSLAAIAVLLVSAGRWGGKLEARRPISISDRYDDKGNGHPTFGEVVRRLEQLERDVPMTYMRQDVARTLAAESLRDRDTLRALISANQRRLDELQGT